MATWPTLDLEQQLRNDDFRFVIGVDEVGRGPLAGPVTASAVVLDLAAWPHVESMWAMNMVRDSKQLSLPRRLEAAEMVKRMAVAHATVSLGPEIIDEINILRATLRAMWLAVDEVKSAVGAEKTRVVIDGNQLLPASLFPQMAVVGGDAKVFTVACASVVAKVTRDAHMDALHEEFPMYDWGKNKGYGTLKHRQALRAHGLTSHHRRSFVHL